MRSPWREGRQRQGQVLGHPVPQARWLRWADWPHAPAGYLQLSEAYHDQAEMARDLGWPIIVRDSHHLAPLTDLGMVAESLHELIDRLSLGRGY